MATPYVRFHHETIASTQDEARRLLADHPAVVVSASSQSAGRGRHGRSWVTAPQALAVSVAFVPSWPPETWPRLTLVAGLAAREAIGGELRLKWPNDLIRDGAKVGGILTEADSAGVVVGLGVNLCWPDPPNGYGACWPSPRPETQVVDLADRFAAALLRRMEADPTAWGQEAYRSVCETLGRRIRWEPNGLGVASDIASDGSLLVETASGVVAIAAGEVWEVRAD